MITARFTVPFALAASILAFGFCPAPARAGDDAPAGALAAVNAARAAAGIAPVRAAPGLACAAARHVRDIAARHVLDHAGADGADLAVRLARAGYRFARAAENLARAGTDAAGVVALWEASPGHRRNLLDPAVTEAGIAHIGTADGTYWVLDLAAPATTSGHLLGMAGISGNCDAKPG